MISNLGLKFSIISKEKGKSKAIVTKDESISFEELNKRSDILCQWLISKKFSQNDIVCISSEKSIFNYSLIIALIKLGITYVVLDRKSPVKRLNKIINQIKPKAIILKENKSLKNKFKKTFIIGKILKKKISNKQLIFSYQLVPSSSIAYLMFTSGSTGDPKGVAISHSKLLFFSDWCKENFDIKKDDIGTNLNPLFFDNSVFDIFGILFNGSCLVALSREEILNANEAVKFLKKKKVSIWFSVPSLITYFQRFKTFTKKKIPTLKKIIFGGEGFPKKDLKKLYIDFKGSAKLYNVYGPTECTCICSSYKISDFDFTKKELSRFAPFGKRLAKNFKYLIIGRDNKEVKIGQVGELFIGGDNVGNGYYHSPEETKTKFVQNPLHKKFNDLFYKSGDLVYQDRNSKLIYFYSRQDNQIKLNGYRIELNEIENNLNSIKGVKECAVTFGNKNKKKEITAWVHTKLKSDFIMHQITNLLPSYMIPKKINLINKIPKNSNGKIDRKYLAKNYYDRKKIN